MENRIALQASAPSGSMPPLEDVIAHYESQLNTHEEDSEEVSEEVSEEDSEEVSEGPSSSSLFSSQEPEIQMSEFSSILSKDLKELCRTLGFSPKGNKKELALRLMSHPKFSSPADIVVECKKDESTLEVVKETHKDPLDNIEE